MTYQEAQEQAAKEREAADAEWRRRRRDELRQEVRDRVASAEEHGKRVGVMHDKDGRGLQFVENHDRFARYIQDAIEEWGLPLTDEQIDAVVILEMQHFGLGLTGRDLLA